MARDAATVAGRGLADPGAAGVLARASAGQARRGHDNDGPLSAEHGFLPVRPPRRHLPISHAEWDALAARLPEDLRSLRLRRAVDRMPPLPATPDHLDDADLQRAATVLGLLAHAYRGERAGAPALPPAALLRPWVQVSRRLGRARTGLTYRDLITDNWRLTGGGDVPRRLEHLRLLVPAAGNAEEEVFYLTQTDILARTAAVVPAAARAGSAVRADDPDGVREALLAIAGAVRDAVRSSLPAIEPRPGRRTSVDPVRWARTVAPLAVPLRPGDLGPSGTSSPLFPLLDALLERPSHDSRLGQESRGHQAGYPPAWRDFLAAVRRTSVPGYVRHRGDAQLREVLAEVQEVYAGPGGFLDRHRRKVFGYLEVAFRIGRDVTIGGFSGGPRDRRWITVDDELERSRAERGTPRPAATAAPVPALPALPATPPGAGALRLSDLVLRNDDEHGHWVVLDGEVHDAGALLAHHPGGPTVLRCYAGRDATLAFRRVHLPSGAAAHWRRRTLIGRLADPALPTPRRPSEQPGLDAWAATMDAVVDLQNTLRIDLESLLAQVGTGALGPLGADRLAAAVRRARDGEVPALLRRIQPLAGLAPRHRVEPQLEPRIERPPAPAGAAALRWAGLARAHLDLVQEVKLILRRGLLALEAGAPPASPAVRGPARDAVAALRVAAAARG